MPIELAIPALSPTMETGAAGADRWLISSKSPPGPVVRTLAQKAALLRASHIIPWADCETDAERLDVGNGLLLSSLWDAAFDAHLVSFADDGPPVAATGLTAKAKDALGFAGANPIGTFTLGHRARLAAHRARTLMTRDGASTA